MLSLQRPRVLGPPGPPRSPPTPPCPRLGLGDGRHAAPQNPVSSPGRPPAALALPCKLGAPRAPVGAAPACPPLPSPPRARKGPRRSCPSLSRGGVGLGGSFFLFFFPPQKSSSSQSKSFRALLSRFPAVPCSQRRGTLSAVGSEPRTPRGGKRPLALGYFEGAGSKELREGPAPGQRHPYKECNARASVVSTA